MKKIEDYTFIEKIYCLSSCLSFILVLFIPECSHLNINIILLIFSSLLSHGVSLFFSSYNTLDNIFNKIDHICIILLASSFFKYNIYTTSILLLLSVLSVNFKNILIFILFFISIIMIYKYNIYLSLYVFLIIISASYYYYKFIKEGWTFMNSWGWHLLILQYFISIKILQLYIDYDKL